MAESVVVIKKLLQMNPKQHSDIIKEMSKLLDQIQVYLTSLFNLTNICVFIAFFVNCNIFAFAFGSSMFFMLEISVFIYVLKKSQLKTFITF